MSWCGWFRRICPVRSDDKWLLQVTAWLLTGAHTPYLHLPWQLLSSSSFLQCTSCAGAGSFPRTPHGCFSTMAGRRRATCRAASPSGTTPSTRRSPCTDWSIE